MKFDIDINKAYEDIEVVIKAPKMDKRVTEIMEKLGEEEKPQLETISGRLDQKIFVINPEDVYLFYSQGGKVYAGMKTMNLEVKQTLYHLDQQLIGLSFIRISKSAIVNVKRIKNIEVSFNGSLVVKFGNGHEEIISRRYVSKVKDFIGLGGK